jgi:hypothetical protein
LRVVPIGASEAHGERARRVHDRSDLVCSCAWRGRSGSAPSACRHTRPARSNCPRSRVTNRCRPWRASQFRSAKCSRSQMPSCCQSRRRRQQVMPDPQPSSCGSICHGIPLRSTNRIPVRRARSETRGRPPFGRGGRAGRSGAMSPHNGSGNDTAAIHCGRYRAALNRSKLSSRRFCYAL